MPQLNVFFVHGRESGPWGTKIRALAKVAERHGCQVISRDDTDNRDPELRVARLVDEASSIDGPVVLVGSSMGGYVATVASQFVRPVGLFLMAPAFGMPGYAQQNVQAIARELSVVLGWDDEIVPAAAVLDFARTHQALLHIVPAGHALLEQVEWLTQLFGLFLDRCLRPGRAPANSRLLSAI